MVSQDCFVKVTVNYRMGPAGFLTLGTEGVRSRIWIIFRGSNRRAVCLVPRDSLDTTSGHFWLDQR